jgi:hypothetical protein
MRMRSTSSSRWMAEASRFKRRSRSASDSSGAGVEDSAGVFEAEGSLDIACVGRTDLCRITGPTVTAAAARTGTDSFLGRAMAAILQSLKRPLRTNIHRTRHYSNGVYLSGLGAAPYLNRLHPRLDTSRCAHGVPWRKSTLSCSRLLSTHTPPLPNLPRARLVSARELYAQRNRSLFMYTSAVVSPRLTRAVSHILNWQCTDSPCCRRILRCSSAVPYVLCGNWVRGYARCRHRAI